MATSAVSGLTSPKGRSTLTQPLAGLTGLRDLVALDIAVPFLEGIATGRDGCRRRRPLCVSDPVCLLSGGAAGTSPPPPCPPLRPAHAPGRSAASLACPPRAVWF